MKLKKLARKALGGLMAMTLVTGMLTSCSKSGSSDKLIENIPADANVVMKFNMQQVIENAGCSVDNGKIVLSEKYSDAIRQAAGATALKLANEYLSYTEGLNLDALMLFSTDARCRDFAAVGTLCDAEAVKTHLKETLGNQKDEDGFAVFKVDGGGVIALTDNMIWIASSMHTIANQIEKAKDGNISSIKAVADMLSADNAMAFSVAFPNLKSMMEKQGKSFSRELVKQGVPESLAEKIASVLDYYACGSVTLDGNSLLGEFFLVDKDGNRAQFGKALNPINTDFLKNVPADANLVAACGNIADPDLQKVVDDAVAEFKANPYNGEARQYVDLFGKWDGTAAMAIEANELAKADPFALANMSENELGMFILSNLKVTAMAHYPADVIANYVSLIANQLSQAGAAPVAGQNGMYSVVTDAFSLYFGNSNGYLTFSNYAGAGDSSSLADKFNGKRMALYSKSDVNPTMAKFGWNFGSEGMMWLDDDALKFKTTLTGTDANFLQAIIEPLTDMDNLSAMMEYFQQLMSNRYSSYYYDEFEPDVYYEDVEFVDSVAVDSIYY